MAIQTRATVAQRWYNRPLCSPVACCGLAAVVAQHIDITNNHSGSNSGSSSSGRTACCSACSKNALDITGYTQLQSNSSMRSPRYMCSVLPSLRCALLFLCCCDRFLCGLMLLSLVVLTLYQCDIFTVEQRVIL
jgi:hypothetical protein